MGTTYDASQVINGTFGEVWVDDYYAAESTALQAKIALDQTDVNQTGTLSKGKKTTGITCTGTLKMNKVTSYMINKISSNLKAGKTTVCTIISKLEDPDALGAERIKLTGCTFSELTLIDWEAGKLAEESIPFSFTDWELLDTIPQLQ